VENQSNASIFGKDAEEGLLVT